MVLVNGPMSLSLANLREGTIRSPSVRWRVAETQVARSPERVWDQAREINRPVPSRTSTAPRGAPRQADQERHAYPDGLLPHLADNRTEKDRA